MMTDLMKLRPFFSLHLVAIPLVIALSACGTLEKLPKVSMPKLPDVNVPFVGDDSTAPGSDPSVPFRLNQPLSHGHTLEIAAFAGQISPSKMFSGRVMVDEQGNADLGKYGIVKLGGLRLHEAVLPLESAFRRKRGQSLINVQLIRVEDTPLLSLRGAVKQPGIIQYFDGATPQTVLRYGGGRVGDASATAVYITRNGVRAIHVNYLSKEIPLEPGDIVTFSDSL
jgi:protein involved in polysaccharide export with SLBB domain